MVNVAVRKTGTDDPFKVVYKGYSDSYAKRVERKWRKRGYDTLIEEIQQDDED